MKNVFAIAALVAAAGSVANGQIFNEIGDATDVLPGQSVTNGTLQIVGFNGGGDNDVFAFSWSGGDLVIDSRDAGFDTQLHLFDYSGNGIGENDDSVAYGLNSEIALTLAAGNYLIGITSFNNDAIDGAALPIFGFTNTFSDNNGNFIQGPEGNGTLAAWDGLSDGGDYNIYFSSAVNAIPAPGAMALLGLGGIAAIRRRR